eukprot:1359879-Pleurochrysis_carterae.AAC.1
MAAHSARERYNLTPATRCFIVHSSICPVQASRLCCVCSNCSTDAFCTRESVASFVARCVLDGHVFMSKQCLRHEFAI